MPVETPSLFANVIQEHLDLKRRNAELELAMPIDRYKSGDPFQNHPLFKTEEQARIEDTMEGAFTLPTEESVLTPDDEESAEHVPLHAGLWSRSRDFDWGT